MAHTIEELMNYLAALGVDVSTIWHAPVFTVAEARELRGRISGAHTKNLFLRDRKEQHFLVTVDEEASVDLKTLHAKIGAAGRVSFGKPERLADYLGILPGAVSLFGAVNDVDQKVKVVIDTTLMEHEIINAHPLTNEATTSIGRDDLLTFLKATGHEPLILKISDQNPK